MNIKISNRASPLRTIITCLAIAMISHQSVPLLRSPSERVRIFTSGMEFNYVTWTLDAIFKKTKADVLGVEDYVSLEKQKSIVLKYVDLIRQKKLLINELKDIYANPADQNPAETAANQNRQLIYVEEELKFAAPLAESILQQQLSEIIRELDLSTLGVPMPPVSYHATPLPQALIISPRDVIRQEANISIKTSLTLEQAIELENKVTQEMGVSALVEQIGGVGTYPTMVEESSDIVWLTEVIAHEWIHNYLQLTPLGLNYDTSSETRTMNETTANMAGKEIRYALLQKYYPEFTPEPDPIILDEEQPKPAEEDTPPIFDFREEMHKTRITVDELLQQGKINEAEDYMEERREYFWQNGYVIRKLNQAYFAFHGAYADSPRGAAGKDPVGPAVRQLRAHSANLADFLRTISRMSTFQQLQNKLTES